MPNEIQNTNNENKVKYPFTIATKGRGVHLGGQRGKLDSGLTLEGLRDKVASWTRAQDKVDHSFPLNMFHYDFKDGSARMAVKNRNGGTDEPMYFTNHGFSQICRELMPNRGGLHMKETVGNFGDVGEKMATLYMNLWASENDSPRLLRTMKTKQTNGDIVRVARSLHSTGYAVYDNVQFLTDLLNTDLGNTQVIDFRMQDNGMRLRFAAGDVGEVTMKMPIPMYEIWNGETGQRSSQIRAGLYRLVCSNGMTSFEANSVWKWRHYGDVSRISQGVGDALHTLEMEANGLLRQYKEALVTSIDDGFAWMEAALKPNPKVSDDFIQRVHDAMKDDTSSGVDNLAGVCDGITLAAQHLLEDRSTSDILEQSWFEELASSIMAKGLRQANGNKILVDA